MIKLRTIAATLTALTIAFAVVAETANAQAPGVPSLKPKLYLGGGSFAVTGPSGFSDQQSGSFSFMGAIGMPLNMGVEVMGKAHYHKFSSSTVFLSLSPIDPEFSAWTYGLDAKYPLIPAPSPARPYIVGGAGAYNFSSSTLSSSSSGMYYNIGVGVDVAIGPAFALFGEAKHTSFAGDADLNILPFVFGVRVM